MEQKIALGIIIRADGTVPFDDDVPPENKAHMIAYLVGDGHHVEPHRHKEGHYFIKNWKKPANG